MNCASEEKATAMGSVVKPMFDESNFRLASFLRI